MPVALSEERAHILKFLQQNPVGVLATVDPSGEPHASAIYFTASDDFIISFLTKTGTKKHENLQHNGHAALVSYEASSQTTVQAKGIVTEVTDAQRIQGIFSEILKISMRTSEAGVPPLDKLQAGQYVAYQFNPKEARMAVFARPDPEDYEHIFEITKS